jgi:hypothetical protein
MSNAPPGHRNTGEAIALSLLLTECLVAIGRRERDPKAFLDEMRTRLLAAAAGLEKREDPDAHAASVACGSLIAYHIDQAQLRLNDGVQAPPPEDLLIS